MPGVEVRQFSGSPMGLLAEAAGCARLVLVDAVCTGHSPVGSVHLFTEEELTGAAGDFFPHGMNVPAVLDLGRRLAVELPSWIRLIGIEVGTIREFAETPEPRLAARLDEISGQVVDLLRRLLA
jgi:hydrogenase maturation protease